ncbi:recombinase family protein [Faecalibacterium langellae]|uniref:recombinase family protein n=1 Tax=Faecalibacterium langellae TaxID=3435293 RepID=UPI00269AF365
MTAVIYARYSSDNQREESIEGQIRECTAYAEKNGITVVKHYIDRALSAKTDNRPDFQQMIKDSEKRLFDIVLVWKLDRFARNRYDSAHYEYQLERNHVKLVSATEPISDSPAGIMVKSMLTGMAEYYSAELSEKVVRGMTENVLKGKYNGGTIPIGFKVDEEKFFQVDPLKAPFVVEAFQRYNDGATMKELMNWLNDSGVTTNRNQKFTYNSVQTLLTNKRYIGENHFKDIVMPDSIPAIVDKDLFEEVQQKIKKNSRAPARHKAEDDYLLTTKLFCGMCGAMMFGECGTGRNKVVHHYYKCATAKRFKTCKKKTVRKEWLEDLVIAETMKLIQDDAVIDAIVAEVMELQDQENTTIPLLEKQMREVENGIENMLNAIQAGVLTSSTKARLEKLEAQQKELEVRIAEEKIARPRLSENQVRFWLTRFRKLDPNVKSHRETLINTFVNAVYLYDEKVLITFNYKDGTKTITFDEIAAKDAPEGNGSDLGCFTPPRKRLCRNTQAFFLCNPAAAIDAGGFEQHRPAEQSGGQKGPCGAFLDARLANPQLSHNCLVSPNGDDRVELFVICSFPIGHAGGFEPKNRGTPHAGHASVFLMFLFCYLTLPCAPAAAGTNRTRCSARRPPEWKWGPPGRSWSGWRSAGCS